MKEAKVSVKQETCGQTALLSAARSGHIAIAKWLITEVSNPYISICIYHIGTRVHEKETCQQTAEVWLITEVSEQLSCVCNYANISSTPRLLLSENKQKSHCHVPVINKDDVSGMWWFTWKIIKS